MKEEKTVRTGITIGGAQMMRGTVITQDVNVKYYYVSLILFL